MKLPYSNKSESINQSHLQKAKELNAQVIEISTCLRTSLDSLAIIPLGGGGGGALGYFLGGYVRPGTSNWHPVLKKNSPKIDTPYSPYIPE